MADNVTLDPGAGGAVIATDDDTTAHHQYVKMEWGADGTFTKVASGASAVPIQDGGNTITVDGTVGVSGTVTVNGSGVTQPVSAVSLPLPTGASTAAKQPALGTAGTASADVITVQGIAAMTPLLVNASGNAVPVTDNSGSLTVDNNGTFATQAAQSGTWNINNVSGTVSLPTGAATAAKQPALGTAGTASADVITVQGIASMTALKVDGSAVTQPVSGTFWQATQPVSLATVPSHAVTNAGTFAVQVDGSALTSLQLIDDGVATVASAITTKGMAAAGTDGTNARILKTDTNGELQVDVLTMPTTAVSQSGTWTVQPGNTANTTPWLVTPTPATSGGLTIFRSIDLDETEEEVKATAGQVFGVWFTNTATSTRWLKFYNATAANVTVGTTTPVITLGLPGNTSDDISGVLLGGDHGIAFGTAITVAATTGVADADTGAPAANDVIVNIFYK